MTTHKNEKRKIENNPETVVTTHEEAQMVGMLLGITRAPWRAVAGIVDKAFAYWQTSILKPLLDAQESRDLWCILQHLLIKQVTWVILLADRVCLEVNAKRPASRLANLNTIPEDQQKALFQELTLDIVRLTSKWLNLEVPPGDPADWPLPEDSGMVNPFAKKAPEQATSQPEVQPDPFHLPQESPPTARITPIVHRKSGVVSADYNRDEVTRLIIRSHKHLPGFHIVYVPPGVSANHENGQHLPGPWAATYALPAVMTDQPEHNPYQQDKAKGLLVEADYGDILQFPDGMKFRLEAPTVPTHYPLLTLVGQPTT